MYVYSWYNKRSTGGKVDRRSWWIGSTAVLMILSKNRRRGGRAVNVTESTGDTGMSDSVAERQKQEGEVSQGMELPASDLKKVGV